MKNVLTILLCLLFTTPNLFAQVKEMQISKNNFSLDLYSFNRPYNLNYERAFIKSKWAIMPKAGLYIGSLSTNSRVNAAYLGLGFLYGQNSHFLRFGIDAMAEKGFAKNTVVGTEKQLYFVDYAIQPTIGYRFQRKKKGLFFSATLRPTFLGSSTRKNEEDVKIRTYNFEFRELPYVLIPSIGIGYSF